VRAFDRASATAADRALVAPHPCSVTRAAAARPLARRLHAEPR
jgi:hypothetical protein